MTPSSAVASLLSRVRRVPRPALGPRDRRALRLGVWIAAPVLAVSLVVRPFVQALAAARAGVDQQRTLLARERAALRDAPRDARLVRAERAALARAALRLFDGADAVAASAELASYVSDRADEAGLEVQESETRDGASAAAGADTTPAVVIRAAGTVLAVVDFLEAMERGPKLARVEQLTIAPDPSGSAGDGGLVLTATVVGRSLRALGDASVVTPEGVPADSETALAAAGESAADGSAADALDNDPFSPDRQLPRFAESDAAVDAAPPPVPSGPVRLLGTVVLPRGRSFAIYQLPSEAPKTVRIGECVGTLTLVAVAPGRATFRAPDGGRVELFLPKAGT